MVSIKGTGQPSASVKPKGTEESKPAPADQTKVKGGAPSGEPKIGDPKGSPPPAPGATPPPPPPPEAPKPTAQTAADAKAKANADVNASQAQKNASAKVDGSKPPAFTAEGIKEDPRFQRLDDATKADVLKRMETAKGDPLTRQNIANLVTSDGFKEINPDHRKAMLDAQAKAPKDKALTEDLKKLAANPEFRNLNDGTKTEVLASMGRNAGNAEARANLADLATHKDFQQLNPGHQKQMLEALDKAPGDKGAVADLKKLAGSAEFRALSDATKTEVLAGMARNAGSADARKNTSELATNKDFQQLNPTHQKQALEALEKAPGDAAHAYQVKRLCSSAEFRNLNDATKSEVLSQVGKYAADPDARRNVVDLATHKDFQQLNPTHQKQMLETLSKAPKDAALLGDLKKLASDGDFRKLNDGVKSGVLAAYGTHSTNPAGRANALELAKTKEFGAAYHKASPEDRKLLDKLLTYPNGDRALTTFTELKKLQESKGSARLTDEMVRNMTLGTAEPRTNAPTGSEGMLSPAQAKRAGEAIINMPQAEYDKFKAAHDAAGKDDKGKPVAGADPALQQQVLLKSVAARKDALTSGDAGKASKAMKEVTDFAPVIRTMGRQDLVDKTTMLDLDHTRNTNRTSPESMDDTSKPIDTADADASNDGAYQRYNTSCGPTAMQTIKGENDPIYAYKTRTGGMEDAGTTPDAAKEQKDLLNGAGGIAKGRAAIHDYALTKSEMDVYRGAGITNPQYDALDKYLKGTGPLNADAQAALTFVRSKNAGFPNDKEVAQIREFPITDPDKGTGFAAHKKVLNDNLGKYTGATYDQKGPFAAGKVEDHYEDMEKALKKGHDVPIGVVDPDHWMSVSDIRGKKGNREFLVHDPWTGKTAWVREQDFKSGQFLKNQFNLGSGAGAVDSVYIPKD